MIFGLLTGCKPSTSDFDRYLENEGKEKVVKIVQEYLALHSEDVVQEAMGKILKRRNLEGGSLAEKMKDRKEGIPTGDSPSKGPANAALTLIQFIDMQNPFSQQGHLTMKQILEKYPSSVRLVFKHNPMNYNEFARVTAIAAEAANSQGKFWEFYEKAISNQFHLTEANFQLWAKELKLDLEKFNQDRKSAKTIGRVERDREYARTSGISASPIYFINGVRVLGAVPLGDFVEIIDALLVEKKENKEAEKKK